MAKIDPVMLHTMGRRLRKWFDWGPECLVEQGKEANDGKEEHAQEFKIVDGLRKLALP